MSGKSIVGSTLLIGGGVATVGLALFGVRKSNQTVEAVKQAVAGATPPLPGQAGPTIKVHTTGYWPYQSGLSAKERLMEGGTTDRKKRPLHTLEQHQSDPAKHPYVSVAGDYTAWPDGQRLAISAWPGVIFRVVDTGGHFHGINKVYRVVGEEPLDICVESSKTFVPKKDVTATIIVGDNFEGGRAVATGGIKGQTVTLSGLVDGYTKNDQEALARALESELGGRPEQELIVAAWAMRNRANNIGTSIYHMLAPKNEYGSPKKSGGYASTRRVPTDKTKQVANLILDAPSAADPTNGAIDFWVPGQQNKLREFGDIYRAALASGDLAKAKKYERYANYGSEGEVRTKHSRDRLQIAEVVGAVELLRRI